MGNDTDTVTFELFEAGIDRLELKQMADLLGVTEDKVINMALARKHIDLFPDAVASEEELQAIEAMEGVESFPEEGSLLDKLRKLELVSDLFEGDGAAAERWLYVPAKALDGKMPIECPYDDVETLVGRIVDGIPS